jgi:hypothetical protein
MRVPGSNMRCSRFWQKWKQFVEIVLTEEGIEIDRRDEQLLNAESPKTETLEPGSNVKSERSLQSRKHIVEIVSTDEGIQIDRSEEQSLNADSPRIGTLQPGAKLTDEMEVEPQKHETATLSIIAPMVTFEPDPKYRTRRVSLMSTKKSPQTLKNRFSECTMMLLNRE